MFGESGAAGTGITGVGIANTRSTPCWLRGTPEVSFFRDAGAGDQPLRVQFGSTGPASLFPLWTRRIDLPDQRSFAPSLGRPFPPVSAGFVILSRDFANGSPPQACQPVAAISVKLPGVTGRAVLATPKDSLHLCDVPSPVGVSPILVAPLLRESVALPAEG